jgi:Mrp family chromosome partitioning ATPase
VLARQRSGSTICAIDGNLRAPALHKEFGLPDGGILTDALLEGSFQENAPQRVSENLWLLQFGIIDSRQNEGRPLDLQHLRRRLTPLREQFDYVLIGAANVSRYPESLMFAQLADGVVLVTEAEETRIETVEQSKRALAGVNANLLGAVLNCKPQRVPDAIHKMFRLK